MGYDLCAMRWRKEEFAAHFPDETTPRRSLPEEMSAIEGMLEMGKSSTQPENADLKKWQPVIQGLDTLKREGLLEAYIFFERADQELARDYPAYRANHRDQLHRYIWVYWCGFE